MSVTRTPSAANMQVYSTPITPPPTTIIVFGRFTSSSTRSLLMMLRPLIGTFGDDAGLVPVAIRMFFASYTLEPREFVTFTCDTSSKLATPTSISMLLRESCASVTSISVLITC